MRCKNIPPVWFRGGFSLWHVWNGSAKHDSATFPHPPHLTPQHQLRSKHHAKEVLEDVDEQCNSIAKPYMTISAVFNPLAKTRYKCLNYSIYYSFVSIWSCQAALNLHSVTTFHSKMFAFHYNKWQQTFYICVAQLCIIEPFPFYSAPRKLLARGLPIQSPTLSLRPGLGPNDLAPGPTLALGQ